MKQNINILSSLLLFLFIPVLTFAAQDDSEAEYGKLAKTYTLHPDGSQEYRYTMELTLFTHTAMNRMYGESFIVYNPLYQELKIHSSYTKQKDGTVVETPGNAFVEVLPRQAADAPAFNHLKEMVVVHTGLELGATIYLDYSIMSKPGYLPELDVCEPILQTSPVKEYTISLSVPEQKPLAYSLTTMPADPVVKAEGGMKQVSWTLHNVKAASREPQTMGLAGDVAFLTATTYPSIKEALDILNKQFLSSENSTLISLSDKIVEGKSKDDEKIVAILRYVSDQLATARLTMPETGFKLRAVNECVSSVYATVAEKTGLLAGLLRAAGFLPEVVVAFHPNVDIDACGLSAIQEFVVFVEADGKRYYLTPDQETVSDAVLLHEYAHLISLATGKPMDMVHLSPVLDYLYTITLLTDKAKLEVAGKVGDAFIPYTDDYINGFTTKDEDGKEERGNGFSMFTYSSSIPLEEMAGNYVLFTLPDVSNSLSHAAYGHYNSKRKEQLLLPYKAEENFKYIVQLPGTFELKTPEIAKKIDNGVGQLLILIKQNGRTVEVSRSLIMKKQLISSADYAAFRQLMIEWGDEKNRQLLFHIDHSKKEE